jgi:flavin reductase (DIM6/NTAB) family NADH-FMN oxidoreductase RutF
VLKHQPLSDPARPVISANAATFLAVMAGVCTPVSVVTAMDGTRPHGSTVSAFASLSLDPPMVLVALAANSELLALIASSGRFGVNVLGEAQASLAHNFARKGDTKFDGVTWSATHGVPQLESVSGWLACVVSSLVPGGDHVVVFGRVVDAQSGAVGPLTYHNRQFGTHAALHVPG